MPWIQLIIDTKAKYAEQVGDMLSANGAQAVTFVDAKDTPMYEPKPGEVMLWPETQVVGLYEADYDMDGVVARMSKSKVLGSDFPHKLDQLEDKDWEREWMDNFHPMRFGQRLWICPSWRDVPDPTAVNVMLDPGLAFGTGTHPTTALCLRWLDALELSDKLVVDFGCGSGILGIAAIKLGAKRVVGIDIDPQALLSSQTNADRNHIGDKIELYLPEHQPELKADVVAGKYNSQGPLRDLREVITSYCKSGGKLVVMFVAVLGYAYVKPLLGLLGATGQVLELGARYMRIWFISVPFLVVPMIANALIRSVGDAFWPSLMMIGSALVNIVATPILIFGWGVIPAFDIEGAAYGTLLAQVLTLFASLAILVMREKLLSFQLASKEQLVASWRYLLSIAVPAAAGNMVNPLSIAIVTAIVAWFGEKSVAAFGVATRIEFFAVIPMLALSSAIGPLAGQNWGAYKVQRIIDGLKISYWVCMVWALVLSAFLWFTGPFIVGAFTDDGEVAAQALSYLRIIPLSVWGYGIVIVAAAAFNSIGKAKVGLGFYVVRSALFYVPLSWLGATFAQIDYAFFGIAVANVVSGVAIGWYSLWWLNHIQAKELQK